MDFKSSLTRRPSIAYNTVLPSRDIILIIKNMHTMALFRHDHSQQEEDTIETVIGPSIKVEGDFMSRGNIIVEGHVNGSVKTTRNLRIGENAVIQANVEAENAIIAGTVEGNIAIVNNLEVLSSARVSGDVTTGRLTIQDGAYFSGNCKMKTDENKKINEETQKDENDQ